MSKLISEEIVEAVTLGDKEGFMSAFQSALAAKVSDALELKKVEIASTLIAPASSEVVEEEVEQIDEMDDKTLRNYVSKRGNQRDKLSQDVDDAERIDGGTPFEGKITRDAKDAYNKKFGPKTPAAVGMKRATDKLAARGALTAKTSLKDKVKGFLRLKEEEVVESTVREDALKAREHWAKAQKKSTPWEDPKAQKAANTKRLMDTFPLNHDNPIHTVSDNSGKVVGTHDYKRGFIPNKHGISQNLKPHPTTVPDGTRVNRGAGSVGKIKKEEVEQIHEGPQKKATRLKNKLKDAIAGDKAIRSGTMLVPDAEPEHKTIQAYNKAVGRALRREEVEQINELGDTPEGRKKLSAALAKRQKQAKGMGKKEPLTFNPDQAWWSYGPKTSNLIRKARKIRDYIGRNGVKEEVEEIEEARKESRAEWRSRTSDEIAKSNKRGKVKVTSAELEARARARRGESESEGK